MGAQTPSSLLLLGLVACAATIMAAVCQRDLTWDVRLWLAIAATAMILLIALPDGA